MPLSDDDFEVLKEQIDDFYIDMNNEEHRYPNRFSESELQYSLVPYDDLNNEQRTEIDDIIKNKIAEFRAAADLRNRGGPNNEEQERINEEKNLYLGPNTNNNETQGGNKSKSKSKSKRRRRIRSVKKNRRRTVKRRRRSSKRRRRS
jgi:hypothetical protein